MQKTCNIIGVEPTQSETAAFCLFILIQMFNAVNARELGSKSVFGSFFNNKLFCILLFVTVFAQVLMTQICGAMFGTVALSIDAWVKIFVIACSVIVISEIYKALYRKFTKKKLKISKRRKFA